MTDLQNFRKQILNMDESRNYTYDLYGTFWCEPIILEPEDPHMYLRGITKSAKEWNKLVFGELND